ncbi:MAG: ABC transporter ATP-binding protein [Planctomycetes bacterium]|nr:ABC transporter ATP-binding protein [Planctomycetota bacterium]
MLVLKTENLSRRFGKLPALDNLSLEVAAGDIYGFLGLNGAGKTTTIRLLLGLIRPQSGRILYYDQPLAENRLAIMNYVGGLVDVPTFYSYLSGRDNLYILCRMRGIPNDKITGLLNELLEAVGIIKRADDKVRTYSQGMRQRLGIASALIPAFVPTAVGTTAGKPAFIILDEPTNGLDPKGIIEMRNLIKRLNKERNATFLISTHLLSEAEKLCNKVGILESGKLVVQGSLQEVMKGKESLESAFGGFTGM